MYYPKSQIQPSQFTNGDELVEKLTKSAYRGYYFKTSTNQYFSGKYPNDLPNIELELVNGTAAGLGNDDTFSDPGAEDFYIPEGEKATVESNYFTLPREYLTSNPLTTAYSKVPRRPLQTACKPTKEDYDFGEKQRYLVKKTNNNLYIEISKKEYILFKDRSPIVQFQLYIPITFPWILTGKNRKAVATLNYKTLELKEKAFKIKGLVNRYKNKYSEYFKPYSSENLTTDGDEFLIKDSNRPYSGSYHIHPEKGPMVGAKHTNSPHSYLIPISGSNLENPQATLLKNVESKIDKNQNIQRNSRVSNRTSGGY